MLGLNGLTREIFQKVVRHAEITAGEEIFLGEVIAVITGQVADRANRFDHHVEGWRGQGG